MPLKAIAFDAYGTLFDVYSVSSLAEKLFPGEGAKLATIWRDKQIEYTRLRTLCDKYADFWQVTGDALEYACAGLGLELTPHSQDRLMGQYAELSAFPENAEQLLRLKDAGITLSILSNGTPWMLDQAIKASGLEGYFEHVLSVDSVKRFKTAPEAYQMGPDALGCDAKKSCSFRRTVGTSVEQRGSATAPSGSIDTGCRWTAWASIRTRLAHRWKMLRTSPLN